MVGVNKAADQKAIKVIGNYVAGQHCKASGSAGHEVFNPASGEVCAHVLFIAALEWAVWILPIKGLFKVNRWLKTSLYKINRA